MLDMNPEIRARWTAALRSGEFVQGIEYLAYNDPNSGQRKNCCMGVLCELALEEGVVTSQLINEIVGYGDGNEMRVLPGEVLEWAGLYEQNPALRPYQRGDYHWRGIGSQMTCSDANDGERLSFSEIADLIDGGVDASS
jgi:hypothetical protein